jgi:toxin-antitoxin system PIN domain toxin
MLVDANVLIYAVDSEAPAHARAAAWLTERLNGDHRVGIPWESLTAFVRIVTHPRAAARPLSAIDAWRHVDDWLAVSTVWTPVPTERHADVFGALVRKYRLTGNLIPDAHLAALAIQHGLEVCSADTDFARFTEIRWHNPVSG